MQVVETEQPDIIVANKNFHKNLKSALHNIIDSSDDYNPDVFLYDSNTPTRSIVDDIFKAFGG